MKEIGEAFAYIGNLRQNWRETVPFLLVLWFVMYFVCITAPAFIFIMALWGLGILWGRD